MDEVYIITIVKETPEDYAEVRSAVYRDFDCAVKAYNFWVDEARNEADEKYCNISEDKEIATDSYRYYRIEDIVNYESITITVETKEIIETEDEGL